MSLLTARNLTMQYPGVRALGGVDFDLRAGEIHALCGENGAGKSTLIKILCGVIPHGDHSVEGGGFTFEGAECRFAGPANALRAGIRVIHQELALCPDLTIAENIFLGGEHMMGNLKWGIPDTRRMVSESRAVLASLGLPDLDPREDVATLPVGLRQMVEIARALRPLTTVPPDENKQSSHRGVLILDEPTSALSAREAEHLLETMQRLRTQGLALLYISHHLDEVFRIADRITVLRNGETTGTLDRARSGAPYDAAQVIAMMVGGVPGGRVPPRHLDTSAQARTHLDRLGAALGDRGGVSRPREGIPLLSVRDWTVASPVHGSRNTVDQVSFDLHAGKILGFAGLMGAGRTELVESLCGLHAVRGCGVVRIAGKPYEPRDGAHALRSGLALVSEDRRAHGLFPDKSVRVNMTISSLRAFCAAGWLTRESRERDATEANIASLRVKTPGTEFPAGNLSGGNQQKTLLARALMTRPKILILDEPTRGIDVGAKEEVYALIARLAADGMGILLISSETEEVLRLAHRVIVLRAGRRAGESPSAELTLEKTLALAAGGTTT